MVALGFVEEWLVWLMWCSCGCFGLDVMVMCALVCERCGWCEVLWMRCSRCIGILQWVFSA